MNVIRFFDTTMRDGEQGIGYLMNAEQKLELLKRLTQLNLDVIEMGMVTDKESQFLFEKAADIAGEQNISALCRLNNNDIVNTVRSLGLFKKSTINLLCVGSELHLEKKMFMSQHEMKKMLSRSIDKVHQEGFSGNIYAILEDSSRGSEKILRDTVEHLYLNGVHDICFADTVGALSPMDVKNIFSKFIHLYPDISFSVHFHNDLGLAVANTLAAIDIGVREVQVTLGGVGERCGNAAFEEVIATLEYCSSYKNNFVTKTNLKEAIDACIHYYNLMNKTPNHNKSLIGRNAFATCAGIHQSAIVKYPETYEYINPERLGLQRKFYFNRLSSKKVARSHFKID